MLMVERGNLAKVREATDALQIGDIVEHDDKGGINAEMALDISPAWYLVEAVPGQEGIAAAHLAGRRFGIFVPDMAYEPLRSLSDGRIVVVRGEKLPRRQRMLVGYIFVFAWLTGRNFKRITDVPGVRRIVHWPEGRIAKMTDAQIDGLRALETLLCPVELPEEWTKEPTRKRYGWRKARRDATLAALAAERTISTIKGWINIGDEWISTVEALRVLDGRDENQAVARALGLAS